MNHRLRRHWKRVALVCALPVTGLATILFVSMWFGASRAGVFDRDLTIGSFVFNAIQLVLLFVLASGQSDEDLHGKIDALHQHLGVGK